jgi:flagellar biosynthetic protein FliR
MPTRGLPAGVLAGIAALIIALPVMIEQMKGVIGTALDQSAALIAPEAGDG